jgi:sterol desaturase/sphingolipid hydroxylase (fatty acid hydroxylase superfamily)
LLHFSFNDALRTTAQNWLGFLVPQERIFILYLLTSLCMAWIVWQREMRKEGKAGKKTKDFLSYIFHPGIYGHKSSWQDYFIFYANGLLHYGIIAQFILTERPFAVMVRNSLMTTFGAPDHPLLPAPAAALASTILFALLYDLAVYTTHWLTHKIPLLWAFHKVHHSAEVLTPVTLLRMHPVDLFLNSLMVAAFTGAGIGVFSWIALQQVSGFNVLGINIFIFLFYFFGYNLRHSHVWLHYPRWLSCFLISPAQHQIHHSTAPRHFDTNMGLIFSIWDRFFGTIYVPKEKEEIVFGINKKHPNPYSDLKDMYLSPFIECRDIMHTWLTKKHFGRLGATAAGVCGIFILCLQMAPLAKGALFDVPTVYLEDLTWTEVWQAQKNGYDTAIIPVGGTEQKGPHMVMGAHNYTVH